MSFDQGRGGHRGRGAGPAASAGLPDRPETRRRQLTGARAYHGGRVAEEQVEAHYIARGYQIASRRWRGKGGEIDLILRDDARIVIVEVKRAETFAIAAERLSANQMRRIYAAASEFISGEPGGQDTEVAFEVALVDGTGRIEIVGNAFVF